MSRCLTFLLLLAAALGAQTPLTTTFAHDAAGLPNGVVFFDLNVAASALTITRLDLNLLGSGTVEVWTKPGTRVGHQVSPGAWTLRAIGLVAGAGPGTPTTVHVPPFVLPQGTSGVALRGIGMSQFTTIGTGANQTWANGDVTLTAGETCDFGWAPPVFAPRVVNCRLHYLVGDHVAVPNHASLQHGYSRGFRFTAAMGFNIRQLGLPPQAWQPGYTASYMVRIDGDTVCHRVGGTGPVDVDVHVRPGDVVDVLGNWTSQPTGNQSAHCSLASASTAFTSILGVAHTLQGCEWIGDVGDPFYGSIPVTPNVGGPIGRLWLTVEPSSTPATNTVIGTGCGGSFGSCFEDLAAASFDLASSALTFAPRPGGGRVVTRTGQWLPVGSTGPVQTLALGDNQQVTLPFTSGSFPGWTSFNVCSNGYVARAAGNGIGPYPSASWVLDAWHEAFWSWHDFDPSAPGSGSVKVEQSASVTVVTWDGVWDRSATSAQGASWLQIQLRATGEATIVWGAVSASGGPFVVGYSPSGLSPTPPETDFSALAAPLVLAAVETWSASLAGATTPVLGQRWDLVVNDLPAGAGLAFDLLGLSDPGIDDLATIGAPGCGLRASTERVTSWLATAQSHTRVFWIPNTTVLAGVDLFATTAVFVTPAPNAFGAITTNGVRGRIGDS